MVMFQLGYDYDHFGFGNLPVDKDDKGNVFIAKFRTKITTDYRSRNPRSPTGNRKTSIMEYKISFVPTISPSPNPKTVHLRSTKIFEPLRHGTPRSPSRIRIREPLLPLRTQVLRTPVYNPIREPYFVINAIYIMSVL